MSIGIKWTCNFAAAILAYTYANSHVEAQREYRGSVTVYIQAKLL
jgi:hypothetical protein